MRNYLLLTIATLLLISCTKEGDTIYKPNPDEEQPCTAPLVTVIHGPNSLGDRSYCDKIYRGIESAAHEYGLRTLQLSPDSYEQGLAYLETMFSQMENAKDSVRRLFIATSPVYDEFIRKNNHRLENKPYTDLLYLETSTPLDGKGSTLYIDYYGAMYMAGYLSRNVFMIDVILLVLANPYTQTVVEAGEGFLDGYDSTVPERDKTLKVQYLSNEPGGGFQLADTTALRIYEESKINASDDVCIVPVCGGAMNAFLQGLPGIFYYIGIDDYIYLKMKHNVVNVIKNIDKVLGDYIRQWAISNTLPKHQTLGLGDGGTDIYIPRLSDYYKGHDELLDSLRQVAIRKEAERYGK